MDATKSYYSIKGPNIQKEDNIDISNKYIDSGNNIFDKDCVVVVSELGNKVFDKHFSEEDIIAVDMESYSIALICDKYHVDWCIVRAISDIIGEESQIDSYQEFASKAANNAFLLIKENYLN